MKHLKTLRVRFALWVAGLLLAALAVFGAFVHFSLAQGLATALDDSLRLSAAQAIAAVNIENGQINFSDSIPASGSVAAELRDRGLTIRVLDATGQGQQAFGPYRDLLTPREDLTAALRQQPMFATVADPASHQAIRFYTAPVIENGQVVGMVQVAQSLATLQATLNQLLAALLFGAPLLVVVAAGGGYLLAARALAPIDEITRTARRISAEDLSARLNLPPTEDEVGRLAATLDEMLARLDTSFRHERQFTADASHELRTPLTAMQAILSVIRTQRRSPEDYEQALADLAEEADRLHGLVEDLLRLARGETQPLAGHERVDLSTLLCDIADSFDSLAEAKGLTLTYEATPGLTLLGDGDGLIRLFVNLLDNAVKYTDQGTIRVTAEATAGGIAVAIADTGRGIPPEHLPHIFDRFYRGEAARSSRGAGLGLAIAQEIARTHGGAIEVRSTLGEGTTFTVRLPQ